MARPKQPATKARWNRVPIGQELTPKQLAEAAGVSKVYILAICQGRRPAFPFRHAIKREIGRDGQEGWIIQRLPNDADSPDPEYDPLSDWT